jgi:hypothetical protein
MPRQAGSCLSSQTLERMEEVLAVFEEVDHVHRHRATSTVPKFTQFSFMLEGCYHPYVAVPGWPEIEAGTSVVAVLRESGNWKTLIGWVNTKTREVAAPTYKDMMVGSAIFFSAFIAIFFAIFGLSLKPYPDSVIQFGVASILFLAGVLEYRRIAKRRAARLAVEAVAAKLR